jgi:peptidyl-prolyl cis-trans isomerase A (cyclophilin A)
MKASPLVLLFGLSGALALAACSKNEPEPTGTNTASPNASVATPTGAAAPKSSAGLASVLHPALLDPSKANEKAPDVFKAKFTTTKGDFVVEVHRDWAPNGADRFYNLVKLGFFDDTRFFRAVDGFMVQFGISGDPAVNTKWQNAGIPADPLKQSNKRGYVTFAQRNTPDSRSTQVFINYADNAQLDGMTPPFPPFGQVTQGMDVVDSLYKGYGEGAPRGAGPDQGLIQSQGNAYLDAKFPKLDGVKHAEIVK